VTADHFIAPWIPLLYLFLSNKSDLSPQCLRAVVLKQQPGDVIAPDVACRTSLEFQRTPKSTTSQYCSYSFQEQGQFKIRNNIDRVCLHIPSSKLSEADPRKGHVCHLGCYQPSGSGVTNWVLACRSPLRGQHIVIR
jgi:hypothetical protein